MNKEFYKKIILVTGGTGTIGSALVKEILKFEPSQVRVLSRDESKQYDLLESLGHPHNLRMLIGDVRDKDRVEFAMRDVDIVFHAAAMKHVPFCEYNPFEAVKTNIIGSQNVIDAAIACNISRVVAISTDKVVNPIGVMGMSKLMMERLFINANYYKGKNKTEFSCVRFGNVTWARGSVLSLWEKQIKTKMEIDVTDPDMTRFMMSQENAINLVLEACKLMRGGEIFVLKMPSIKMMDLANLFNKKYYPGKKIGIKIVGERVGEKKHEELLNVNTGKDKIFENDRMLAILPDVYVYGLKEKVAVFYQNFKEVNDGRSFSSRDCIDMEGVNSII